MVLKTSKWYQTARLAKARRLVCSMTIPHNLVGEWPDLDLGQISTWPVNASAYLFRIASTRPTKNVLIFYVSILLSWKVIQGVQKKTDTIIFCYNFKNIHSTIKNRTCLYSPKHGKTDGRCHVACTPPGQSWQLLKADARCEPPSGGLAPATVILRGQRSASDDSFDDYLGGQTGGLGCDGSLESFCYSWLPHVSTYAISFR